MSSSLIYFIIAFVGATVLIYIAAWLAKGKKKTQFDERQLLVRGNAFKYGFFTVLVGITIQIVIFITEDDVQSLFYPSAVITLGAGLCVYCVYSIWNDAYIGVNENVKSIYITNSVIAAANLIIGFMNFADNGADSPQGYVRGLLNIVLGAVFLVMLVTLLLKNLRDRKEA